MNNKTLVIRMILKVKINHIISQIQIIKIIHNSNLTKDQELQTKARTVIHNNNTKNMINPNKAKIQKIFKIVAKIALKMLHSSINSSNSNNGNNNKFSNNLISYNSNSSNNKLKYKVKILNNNFYLKKIENMCILQITTLFIIIKQYNNKINKIKKCNLTKTQELVIVPK